jgi:hypothetical protein
VRLFERALKKWITKIEKSELVKFREIIRNALITKLNYSKTSASSDN